ncbi:MAG: hypothetical protein WB586_08050 [Chthoniobacterales bacterium]
MAGVASVIGCARPRSNEIMAIAPAKVAWKCTVTEEPCEGVAQNGQQHFRGGALGLLDR